MKTCTHNIVEMDTAMFADGLCPLCLAEDSKNMRNALRAFITWFDSHEPELRELFDEPHFYELQGLADAGRDQL